MKPEIYFHVGLGKVASTYLQQRLFPKLQNIHYIPSTKYKRYQDVIQKTQEERYFLSREFDNQLEYEVSRFAKHYPDAKIIIAFRQHDGWIASQYRRYVKNGGHRQFNEFFDVEKDMGLWKKEQVYFMPKLRILEQYFHEKPLLLFHEDLKNDAFGFFDEIADYSNTTYDKETISLAPVHKSYSTKQLKFIRSLANKFFKEPPNDSVVSQQGIKHWIKRRSKLLACYATMYSSAFFPESFVGNEPLIAEADLKKVRDYFEEDWQAVQAYKKDLQ